jgi:hypothetical protein
MTGRQLADDDLRRLRMESQRLVSPRGSVLDSVTRLVGVQAQDSTAAALNIRARSSGTDAKTVDTMLGTSRSLVRTWAMRGTLHVLAARDVHWLVRLLGPRFSTKYRSARLMAGLTETLLERAIEALPGVVRSSDPITRAELVKRLSDAGIKINPKGQAPAHLVVAASLRGIVCCGPDAANGKSTYVRLNEWIPHQNGGPEDPLGELAKRYLEGHGPASASDFAAWSGLPVAEARDAIQRVAGAFEEAEVHGERAWFRTPTGSKADVRLLGGFDSYWLAYRQRQFAVARRYSARVQPGGGIIRPFVLVGGRIEGTWYVRNGRVVIDAFGKQCQGLEQEVCDVERFLTDTSSTKEGVTIASASRRRPNKRSQPTPPGASVKRRG